MYVSTDLYNKSGISEVKDQLNFMLSLKPEDVPFTDMYGIRVTATEATIKDVAQISVVNKLESLNIPGLTITGASVNGRDITIHSEYDGASISNTLTTEE